MSSSCKKNKMLPKGNAFCFYWFINEHEFLKVILSYIIVLFFFFSLRNTIKEMKKVTKMMNEIETCKKKILWCDYEKLRHQVDHYEEMLKEAKSLKTNLKDCLKPSNEQLKSFEIVNQNLEKLQSSSVNFAFQKF